MNVSLGIPIQTCSPIESWWPTGLMLNVLLFKLVRQSPCGRIQVEIHKDHSHRHWAILAPKIKKTNLPRSACIAVSAFEKDLFDLQPEMFAVQFS